MENNEEHEEREIQIVPFGPLVVFNIKDPSPSKIPANQAISRRRIFI